MGRPRRPYNGVEKVEWDDDRYRENTPGGLGVRPKRRMQAQSHWGYRAVNGVYDPLTYLHVLDVVAGIDPDIELRTKNLVKFLNEERPQFYWDTITVGRVLNDIREYFEDKLGGKGLGLLEHGQDYKGAFYRIHINEDTVRLFHKARVELAALAEIERTLRDRGEPTKRLMSPLQEVPSLREEWVYPEDEPVAVVG